MFSNMFKGWFAPVVSNYNEFIRALLEGNVKAMNLYMNDVALCSLPSSFDVEAMSLERTQINVLPWICAGASDRKLRSLAMFCSNRESGFGRYDVMAS